MTTREALTTHYAARGLLAPGESVEDRLRDRWIRMRVRGRLIPVKPLLGHQHAFVLHDVHHLVTGYGTSLREELEIAAWEMGSGGCGHYVLFWIGRVNAIVLGLVLCPLRTIRALRAGLSARNLYRFDCVEILDCDVDAVRAYIGGSRSALMRAA